MILIIDTTEKFKLIIGLKDKKTELFECETKNQSDDLLVFIKKTLESKDITLQEIVKIFVNIGPGSYTGVRVGVAMANALGWSLDKPVIGYKSGELEKQNFDINSNDKFSGSVLPYYDN